MAETEYLRFFQSSKPCDCIAVRIFLTHPNKICQSEQQKHGRWCITQETHQVERCLCKSLEYAMFFSASQKQFCTFQRTSFRFCLWRCKLGGTPWRSTELKECEIDARERRRGKSSVCFSPCTLASESASWFIKACYSPFYFPLEKQTISIQLHLLGKQNRKNWSFGGVFFCWGFFFTTGNIKHTEEGDTTKQVLSYSNSVHLHCSQWNYTDLQ